MSERKFPIQNSRKQNRERLTVPEPVYMAAYEVYCHVFSPQDAMIDHAKGCRGGFGMDELVGFLYARGFPKDEWRARAREAWDGMNL